MRLHLLVCAIGMGMLAGLSLCVSGCARKQVPLPQSKIEEEAKFYGGNADFTATRVVTAHSGGWVDTKEIAMALSDGNLREERAASEDMPAFVVIRRPDLDTIYRYWPGERHVLIEQGYWSTRAHDGPDATVTQVADIGPETINGHPCVKCKVTIQEGKTTIQWTRWDATDLNRFPIHAEVTSGRKTSTIEFTNVKIGKPDPSLFEPPADYTRVGRKFKNTEEAFAFALGSVLRSMSDAGKGK